MTAESFLHPWPWAAAVLLAAWWRGGVRGINTIPPTALYLLALGGLIVATRTAWDGAGVAESGEAGELCLPFAAGFPAGVLLLLWLAAGGEEVQERLATVARALAAAPLPPLLLVAAGGRWGGSIPATEDAFSWLVLAATLSVGHVTFALLSPFPCRRWDLSPAFSYAATASAVLLPFIGLGTSWNGTLPLLSLALLCATLLLAYLLALLFGRSGWLERFVALSIVVGRSLALLRRIVD